MKWIYLTIFIFVLIVALGAVGYFFWQRNVFSKDDIKLEIQSFSSFKAGEEVEWKVICINQSKVVIETVILSFYYPKYSIPLSKNSRIFTEIGPGQEREVVFRAQIFGKRNEEEQVSAKLEYNPRGLATKFSNEAPFSFNISSVPLSLVFNFPQAVTAGQEIFFNLNYISNSEFIFPNLYLKIDYPEGFKFINSEPKPISNYQDFWSIGDFQSREEEKISIHGFLEEGTQEHRSFGVKIGIYNQERDEFISWQEKSSSLKVISPPLLISQVVNSSSDYIAFPGDILNYRIRYKNNSESTIKDLFINVKLESKALDFGTLKTQGYFNSRNNTIFFNAAAVSWLEQLNPKEEGEVEFRINLKKQLIPKNPDDRNFVIFSEAKIDSSSSPFLPTGAKIANQNKIETKINSVVTFDQKGFFVSGYLPPKVGETTIYTITWEISNSFNDLSQVRVEGSLPPYIKWQGSVTPKEEKVSYNDYTGKVTWEIGDLSAGVGYLFPEKKVSFKISLTPSLEQKGKVLDLIEESKVKGIDSFTNSSFEKTDKSIDTRLPDDDVMKGKSGRVGE